MFEDEKRATETVQQAPEKSTDEKQSEAYLRNMLAGDFQAVQENENPAIEGQAITDPVESLAGLFGMIGMAFGFAGYKRVSAVWSNDGNNHALAYSTVPVLQKYAWGQKVINVLSGKVPVEELALLMAVAPFAVGTYVAIKQDAAEKKGETLPESGAGSEGGGLWSKIVERFAS